jgi:hypothetical protein
LQFRRIVALWPVGLFIAGLVAVVAGVALISTPAALIVFGMALAALAIHEVYF